MQAASVLRDGYGQQKDGVLMEDMWERVVERGYEGVTGVTVSDGRSPGRSGGAAGSDDELRRYEERRRRTKKGACARRGGRGRVGRVRASNEGKVTGRWGVGASAGA